MQYQTHFFIAMEKLTLRQMNQHQHRKKQLCVIKNAVTTFGVTMLVINVIFGIYTRCQWMKFKVMLRNSSVVKIYMIRPKPGQVAKNATICIAG